MRVLPLVLLPALARAIRPNHSWDTLGGMTYFHSCNESGLFSERALDTIARFPMVTIEKGQGFDAGCADYGATAPCAEQKITAQCEAVKKRDASIATVFYMNSVLSWYFYHMDVDMNAHPAWQLHDSKTGEAVHTGGDKHFNPPKSGMLVYNHAAVGMREYWKAVCINATKTGFVDGCFSDSSQPGSHKTSKYLNSTDNAAFEAGKVQTMTEMTAHFGVTAGAPYAGSTGVLIGKKPDQKGINAFQIEMFQPDEASIQVLMQGVSQGYLVQAHTKTGSTADQKGCNDLAALTDMAAAFLIGAGDDSYFGSGPWIAAGIADVEQRWCAPLYERPLGKPAGPATKTGNVYQRSFASGTEVLFDTGSNKGTINWAGGP